MTLDRKNQCEERKLLKKFDQYMKNMVLMECLNEYSMHGTSVTVGAVAPKPSRSGKH